MLRISVRMVTSAGRILKLIRRLWADSPSSPSATKRDRLREIIDKAQSGNPYAQFIIGTVYQCGLFGLATNSAEAAQWYSKAATKGYSKAECALADLYKDGALGLKDYDRALELYRRASTHGDAKATMMLGDMYLEGLGVEPRWKKASNYYRLAARSGYHFAYSKLAMVYYYGYGVRRSDLLAGKWGLRFIVSQLRVNPLLLIKYTWRAIASKTGR